MSEFEEDIDFDFFGEPEPEPPKKRSVRRPSGPPPGGGSPPPRRPTAPPGGATPIFRLVAVIAFAIAAILVLVFAVRSCEASNASAAYKSYLDKVATIATDSASVGKQLNNDLADQNLNQKKLETKLQGLIEQQDIDIKKASELSPPGPLRRQQEKMVEALELRSKALNGLLAVFKRTTLQRGATEGSKAGRALSAEAYKAVASDVIWADSFVAAGREVLQKEGVSGVSPPSSVFLPDPDLATRSSMTAIWERIHGIDTTANTTGGRHGTGIAYVKVTPSDQTLSLGATAATIVLKENLAFVVGVKNTGDYLEQNINVRLVIQQTSPNKPIQRTQKILQIYNGETKEVVFKGPFDIGNLINPVPLKVDVAPVVGEAITSNNKYTYSVRFSLSP